MARAVVTIIRVTDGNFSNLNFEGRGKLLVICLGRNSRFRERGKALGCDSRHSYLND